MAFKRIEMASITVMTISGGFVKTLISDISALSKESSALLAASSAGRASSRSIRPGRASKLPARSPGRRGTGSRPAVGPSPGVHVSLNQVLVNDRGEVC